MFKNLISAIKIFMQMMFVWHVILFEMIRFRSRLTVYEREYV
jgi:hypothetical protein